MRRVHQSLVQEQNFKIRKANIAPQNLHAHSRTDAAVRTLASSPQDAGCDEFIKASYKNKTSK